MAKEKETKENTKKQLTPEELMLLTLLNRGRGAGIGRLTNGAIRPSVLPPGTLAEILNTPCALEIMKKQATPFLENENLSDTGVSIEPPPKLLKAYLDNPDKINNLTSSIWEDPWTYVLMALGGGSGVLTAMALKRYLDNKEKDKEVENKESPDLQLKAAEAILKLVDILESKRSNNNE